MDTRETHLGLVLDGIIPGYYHVDLGGLRLGAVSELMVGDGWTARPLLAVEPERTFETRQLAAEALVELLLFPDWERVEQVRERNQRLGLRATAVAVEFAEVLLGMP